MIAMQMRVDNQIQTAAVQRSRQKEEGLLGMGAVTSIHNGNLLPVWKDDVVT
jgi:hypothetical protein